ncbi:predicted protein [Sclerotinia sclerotiorum 1980 UF-70]|uniref:Uncharacterized protein n=1 Tax=Sclerotinia sclerotiorum (strain ATCC 18683 / 1980 / Ss-1) TaxID=665079 RepID=A7EB88_SCLS1|nr:predicted protein [Sclerotinia sclerotiorum 1980 UF-70]EDN99716.1 predicted protein [Sclerotinia sclerotiorum 1980 UF-70]
MLAQLLNQLQIPLSAIQEQVIFAMIEYRVRVHMDGGDVGIRLCATRRFGGMFGLAEMIWKLYH